LGQLAGEIRALGAEPVAVAVTATFSQLAFAESLGVDFPMLSDWDGVASARYGARYEVWKGHVGLAKRSVFVIDSGGTIRFRWQSDDALELPDLGEVIELLRGLRA
jgi:peroxiredoxin